MSYRCGVDEPLASMMGGEPGGPRIACDGCGLRCSCEMAGKQTLEHAYPVNTPNVTKTP